jgi:hypothetical protein
LSIPLTSPVPQLISPSRLSDWARDLSVFLTKHLPVFAWIDTRVSLANGLNNNVNVKGANLIHVVGPTGAFSITGFGGGTSGRELIVQNDSAGTMTFVEESGSSQANNRITTYSGNVVSKIARFIWDTDSSRWIMASTRP